jgi:hypothetical protein
MLDLNCFACNACCLRCVSDGTKSFFGMLLHARFELSRRLSN